MHIRNSLSKTVIFALLVSLAALPFASNAGAQGAAPAPDLPLSDEPPPNTVVPGFVLDLTAGISEEAAAPELSSADMAETAGVTSEEGAAPAPDLPLSDVAPPNTIVPGWVLELEH
ncbi:MAG TPA: hypothetical protein VGK54_08745 [Chloroflexota bacterium]